MSCSVFPSFYIILQNSLSFSSYIKADPPTQSADSQYNQHHMGILPRQPGDIFPGFTHERTQRYQKNIPD